MILKELLRENEEVFTLTAEDRVSTAAELMRSERVGSIVIVENRKVAGIVTDRDIALTITLGAATADSFLREIMTKDIETVDDSMTLFEVTQRFRNARVKRLPVVDSESRLVGIVSADDVIALLAREMLDTSIALEPKLGYMV